ncbi:MAG TPA: hypothetical protein VGB97_03005 [Candidatus Paceibacterota bacterium]|jgi:hypothetical protein
MSDIPTSEHEAFAESLRQLRYRGDLRRSLSYLNILLGDIDLFEGVLASDASNDEKRVAFQRLMTLTLGSSSTWDRLRKVSRLIGIGEDTIGRYALRTSAPMEMVFPMVTKALREIITNEITGVEGILRPLEEAEKQERERRQAEWEALRVRVETVVPGNGLNCQVRFPEAANGRDDALVLIFSYPCRGIYELSCMYTHVCPVCEKEGRESSHTHGKVVLLSEDGTMLLPHIVRTQADLMQVVEDMRTADEKARMFLLQDNPTWYDDCKQRLLADSGVAILPPGDAATTEPVDLAAKKLGWWT